ncbi:MAG: hypothetical protein ACXVIG_03630 [Halobacteriota archaeon]
MDAKKNMQLMQTLDDAWNTRDWDTFNKRHAEGVVIYWPGQPEPTKEDLLNRPLVAAGLNLPAAFPR